GDLVGGVVELSARVQDRHDHFGRGPTFLGMDVDGNSPAVVGHRDGLIRVDGHDDAVAVAGQGLIDGVVDDLEHHVVQTGAVIGIPDVHARAFSHRVKTF